MEFNVINIVYHPTAGGYSAYSHELDGLNCDAPTVEELAEEIKHLIQVRAESLAEIGKTDEAKELLSKKVVLKEN